jgi:hypothetical protein
MKISQALEAGGIGLRNLILGSNLMSLTLLGQPQNLMRSVADSLFLLNALAQRRPVPSKNVFEVLPARPTESVKLGAFDSGEAWFGPQPLYTQDLISLCLIGQILQPKVVFEIGTLNGYTAHHFALNTPAESRIYTLDLPREPGIQADLYTTALDDLHIAGRSERDRYAFEGSETAGKIVTLSGDSARFDFSPYHGRVDFFFIDGAHSYEYVRSDTLNALRCCHPGSVIAWHDFGKASLPGVTRWIGEFARFHPVFAIPGGSVAFMQVGDG